MSMNLFLTAFSAADLAAMKRDHGLVDDWVEDDERCLVSSDIGDAWDVLNKLLDGTGFRSDEFLDDVLLNGAELVEVATVKQHAAALSGWSHERLQAALRDYGPTGDAYHLEVFLEHQEDLVEAFDKLAAFYREAASKNLAVLHYAA